MVRLHPDTSPPPVDRTLQHDLNLKAKRLLVIRVDADPHQVRSGQSKISIRVNPSRHGSPSQTDNALR
jgi:hypothetical protein